VDFQCSRHVINGLLKAGPQFAWLMAEPVRERTTSNKEKRRRKAGLFQNRIRQFRLTSVLRDNRTAPAVVDANRRDIDVLTNAIFAREHAGSNRGVEVQSTGSHEHVVVLEA
jgi:hypothetical protein